jgi:hypothetical protein
MDWEDLPIRVLKNTNFIEARPVEILRIVNINSFSVHRERRFFVVICFLKQLRGICTYCQLTNNKEANYSQKSYICYVFVLPVKSI